MSTDPRTALENFVSALYEHLASANNKRGDDDPALDHAYQALANAYINYEEALAEATGEYTPFDLEENENDDEDFADFDDDEDLEFDELDEDED